MLSVRKTKESVQVAEERLLNPEDKFVNEKIDQESYSMLRPKYQSELRELKAKLAEIQETDTNAIELNQP